MGLGSDSALDDLIHSGLHGTLGRFYPATVVIQQATIAQRPNGEQVQAWGTFLSGLYGNLARVSDGEQRWTTHTTVTANLALNLKGVYPTITTEHRALVTMNGSATVYNITAVAHDSLGKSTRLDLEIVEH